MCFRKMMALPGESRKGGEVPLKVYINGRFLTQQMTGVQRYGHELVKSIDAEQEFLQRFDVTVLVPARGAIFEPSYRNIEVRKVGHLRGHRWEQLELPRYCGDGLLFCPGNTAPILRLVLGGPTVVTLHSLSYMTVPEAYAPSFRLLYKALVPLILRLAGAVITVSASEAESIASLYPFVKPRLTAIQNGGFDVASASVVKEATPRNPGFPYGLFVGSLSKGKNFPALLDAAVAAIRETGIGFVFVGGTQAALQRGAAEVPSDLRGKFLFAGQVNDSMELVRWYKGAEFLAFPSLYEASPFPPIEAMSCGCPVIASAIPSLRERCGTAALYCDPYSTADIASAMIRLVRDKQLRTELIDLGLKRAAEFSWKRCASETLRVLERVARPEYIGD